MDYGLGLATGLAISNMHSNTSNMTPDQSIILAISIPLSCYYVIVFFVLFADDFDSKKEFLFCLIPFAGFFMLVWKKFKDL